MKSPHFPVPTLVYFELMQLMPSLSLKQTSPDDIVPIHNHEHIFCRKNLMMGVFNCVALVLKSVIPNHRGSPKFQVSTTMAQRRRGETSMAIGGCCVGKPITMAQRHLG